MTTAGSKNFLFLESEAVDIVGDDLMITEVKNKVLAS